jgi:ribosomal protein RSM22 (predicted rRNA methylase)
MKPELKAAVERELARKPGTAMRAGASNLSAHYRSGGRSDGSIDLSAYLAVRLPATFAAVRAALEDVQQVRPGLAPGSVLDAGSGPGTASWAAAEVWPGLSAFTMLDSNPSFLSLAQRLAAESPHEALSSAAGRVGEIERLRPEEGAELVIAAYALAEIPATRLSSAIRALWDATREVLVLVEPGTPAGFARLKAARVFLLGAGAVAVAPCPHAGACPMTGDDWCHFSVRLARSRAHMHAKGASVPYEDEKFAYLAVARDGAVSGGARVLTPPVHAKPGIDLRLCTAAGLVNQHIARRDSAAYKRYRKLDWGDLIGPAEENVT